MHDSSEQGLIGIDGGGTSCRIALVWQGARHEVREASANVTTDLPQALSSLETGLTRAAETVGLPLAQIKGWPAYLGLAGAISPALQAAVAAGLGLTRAWVEDDRHSALVGAFGDRDGLLIGIGTGSFLARQSGGAAQYVGGYGLTLSDQASAAWLGRFLLAEVLTAADGLAPHSPLTQAVFEEFDQTPARIVAMAKDARPSDFGAFAPRLFEAARTKDATATRIIGAGVEYITHAATALGWQPGEAICPLGGVAPAYVPYLPAPLQAAITEAKGSALDGALRLAARIPAGAGATP